MQLSNYISDLLFRYECVIVPEFGGFITNTISSKVNHFTHTFYPPTKKISFNSQLTNNDGLLANYIADIENISFEQAVNKIATAVKFWNTQLQNEVILINKIGNLSLNEEQKIIFEPLNTTNYLTSSFGLDSLNSSAIKREAYKGKTILLETTAQKKSPGYLKYAATVAVFLTLGAIGWQSIEQNQIKSLETEYQEKRDQKIEEATFIISNPLPAITLDIVKTLPKRYHIIAGAFGEETNAFKKVKQLKKKGFKAEIIGINKWGLTQVAFESYTTREDAVKNLKTIKKSFAKDAWLFVE